MAKTEIGNLFPFFAYNRYVKTRTLHKINLTGWNGGSMRYFYYGKETEERGRVYDSKRKENVHGGTSVVTSGKESDLIIEEDTIYEVDRMCLCRRPVQKSRV